MEGHMGDYWNIATSAADIRAFPSEGVMSSVANVNQPFLPFGTGTGRPGTPCDRDASPYESFSPSAASSASLACFRRSRCI